MAPKASSAGGSSAEHEGAGIVTGAEALPKFAALVQALGFPGGMFPLPGVEEFGFVEKTGFFWIKQPGRQEHTFPLAQVLVVCYAEVSGRIVQGRTTAVKWLKLKRVEKLDLFLATSASEICIDAGKIVVRTSGGKHPTEESFFVEAFAAGQ